MSHLNRWFCFFVYLGGTFFLSPAMAQDFRVSPLGGITLSNVNISTNIATSTGVSGGGGVLLGTSFSNLFGVELGLLYLAHTVSENVSSVSSNFNYNALAVPVLFYYSPQANFSLHVGAFTSLFPNGSVSSASSSGSTPVNTDFGLAGGISGYYPVSSEIRVRMMLLYEFGLANISGISGLSLNSRNVDIFAGVQFDL